MESARAWLMRPVLTRSAANAWRSFSNWGVDVSLASESCGTFTAALAIGSVRVMLAATVGCPEKIGFIVRTETMIAARHTTMMAKSRPAIPIQRAQRLGGGARRVAS